MWKCKFWRGYSRLTRVPGRSSVHKRNLWMSPWFWWSTMWPSCLSRELWSRGRQRHCNMVCDILIAASCFALEHKKHTKMHFRYVPQFSSYMFTYTFTDPWPVCVYRRLGWIRLFFYLGLGQPGLGNVAWHSALCSKINSLLQDNRNESLFVQTLSFRFHFLPQNKAHRFLRRMGHSLVSGPQGTLWMYGGLSLPEGILGNVYR